MLSTITEYICPACGHRAYHSNPTTLDALKNYHQEFCPKRPKPQAPTAKPPTPATPKPAAPAQPAAAPTQPPPPPKPTTTILAAPAPKTVSKTAGGAKSDAMQRVGYNPKPIDPNFASSLKQTGEHSGHKVYGEGVEREDADGNPYPSKLGIHGIHVAVDWEACIADGACMDACPVNVFDWLLNAGKFGKGKDKDLSQGTEEYEKYRTDKCDPLRESDCIFCMACETVCPTTAIKITPK